MSKEKIYEATEPSPYNTNENQLEPAPTSNITGKPIDKVFDYGEISEKDKKVVKEVLSHLHKDIPFDQQVELIKKKFQITEIPTVKLEESIWYQFTKDFKLGQSIQGLSKRKNKDGEEYNVPHIGFSADLDYLDNVIEKIIEKVKQMKFPE